MDLNRRRNRALAGAGILEIFLKPVHASLLHNVHHGASGDVAHGAIAAESGLGHGAPMNLARIRSLRNLSQRDLADMIGMDAATVQRAETCHKSAKLTTYRACAKALGVTLADIFSDDRSAIEQELLDTFRKIPESRHGELLRLLALARQED